MPKSKSKSPSGPSSSRKQALSLSNSALHAGLMHAPFLRCAQDQCDGTAEAGQIPLLAKPETGLRLFFRPVHRRIDRRAVTFDRTRSLTTKAAITPGDTIIRSRLAQSMILMAGRSHPGSSDTGPRISEAQCVLLRLPA